ncbi:MAG TPA: hypothetical protein VK504_17455 [Vicinamibacterales bacterium]|nr:hypothetical protein [Vicinamibacterales bacterium]
MPRYIFFAGHVDITICGEVIQQEIWLGLETPEPIDLEEFSREHGYDLIPAGGLSAEELQSVGVTDFPLL